MADGGNDGIAAARAALSRGESALIWRRQIADTDTPISAALKLFEPDRGDYLLESVEGGAVRGRHSLIGLAPDLVFRANGQKAEINRHWATDRNAFQVESVGALDALRALVDRGRVTCGDVAEHAAEALRTRGYGTGRARDGDEETSCTT